MGKKLERLTERHMMMLEAKMLGHTFKEIGKVFNIGAAGARIQIHYAANMIRRMGVAAFPEGYVPTSPEEGITSFVQTLFSEPCIEEKEYTIAITKQQVCYVKVRATSGKDARYLAQEIYGQDRSKLPAMEDSGYLNFSIVEAAELSDEEPDPAWICPMCGHGSDMEGNCPNCNIAMERLD